MSSPQGPLIKSIFDFSSVALGELRTWFEQSPPSTSIKSIPGYTTATGLTGIFNGAGAISGGTGFTVVRNSLGNYSVTFNNKFGQSPIVHCQIVDSGVNPREAIVSAATVTGFTVQVVDSTGTHADVTILFSVLPVA